MCKILVAIFIRAGNHPGNFSAAQTYVCVSNIAKRTFLLLELKWLLENNLIKMHFKYNLNEIIFKFPFSRMSNLPRIGMMNSAEPIIGFQVDRVKHSELGEGKVRLTAYYVSTGKVGILQIVIINTD